MTNIFYDITVRIVTDTVVIYMEPWSTSNSKDENNYN